MAEQQKKQNQNQPKQNKKQQKPQKNQTSQNKTKTQMIHREALEFRSLILQNHNWLWYFPMAINI